LTTIQEINNLPDTRQVQHSQYLIGRNTILQADDSSQHCFIS